MRLLKLVSLSSSNKISLEMKCVRELLYETFETGHVRQFL